MTPKRIITVALIGVLLFVGIKYSLAYINWMQLKTIMEDEALDARRTRATESEIEGLIFNRVDSGSAFLPDEVEFEFEGVGDKSEDLVIFATYDQPVDLLVYTHVMRMRITAVAEPPID